MEWEYRGLVIGAGKDNFATLNRLGAEGWEISVFIDPVLIFKRPKPIDAATPFAIKPRVSSAEVPV